MTEQPPEPSGNAPLQEERAARADKPLPAPILVCDEPEEGAVVTRGTVVSGWVLSAAGIREVSVWMDGQRMVGETEYGLLQEDVAQDYPDWPNALRSGFCYRFKEVPFSDPTQSAELVVAAEDRRGRRAEVRRVVRRNAERIIKEKKQKLRRTNKTRDERRRRRKRARQEIFLLESELRVLEEGGAHAQVAATGALPDFLIIGAAKSGTASLYHLLIQHPHVEPCAHKEIHFLDLLFDDGVEWYRRCFPTPRWKDGRKTITGEATPAIYFTPIYPRGWRRLSRTRGL